MLNHLWIYNTTRLPVLFVLCSLSLSLSFSFFRGSVFHKAPDTRQGERVFNRTAERMHGQKVGADKPPNYSSSSSPFLSVLLFFFISMLIFSLHICWGFTLGCPQEWHVPPKQGMVSNVWADCSVALWGGDVGSSSVCLCDSALCGDCFRGWGMAFYVNYLILTNV